MNWISFVFLILLYDARCKGETCSASDEKSCQESSSKSAKKYSKDANTRYARYLSAVEKAEASYVECTTTKCFDDVITRDLETFAERGIDKKLIEAAKFRGTFYQIIQGKLYREKNCMFPSRCAGIEHFLLKIVGNVTTDISLVVNTRDYPQSSRHFGQPFPVFSFSKTPEYYDITYPAWVFWEGGPAISLYPRGLGRWDLHRKSLDGARKATPWEAKEEKAFFRGSRTSSERDNLVLLSRAKPQLVDAQYTKNQAWKSEKDTLDMPPAEEVSLESHCAYKYLFNYRGVAASFRHKHLFLCGSLVFHVGDEWTEFYYEEMKPWIHYIPVPKLASQQKLEELIQFVKDNDAIAKRIADRGRNFIWERLRMSDVIYYWKELILRYSKLFKYRALLEHDLIKIQQK